MNTKIQKENITTQAHINSESEMPPIKKKDFFEMIKNRDDAYNQKQKDIFKLKADNEIQNKKLKALIDILEKEKSEKELLLNKLNNKNDKNDKTTSEYALLMKKSKETKEYMEKNEQKFIKEEIDKMKDDIDQFEKKYGVKLY